LGAGLLTAAAQRDDAAARRAALKDISNTAAEICYTVEQRGSKNDAQLQGEVQAKVTGVVSKLANVEGKVAGQASAQEYQGVAQDALNTALGTSTQCRQHVFDELVARLFPAAAGTPVSPPSSRQSEPGSVSSAHRLPPADKTRGSDSIALAGGLSLSLYRCINTQGEFLCHFILKKTSQGIVDFKAAELISSHFGAAPPRLIDNFRINHRMSRATFVNGRNQEQDVVTLGQDDSVWLTLEFEGAAADITKAQLVFGNSQIQAPIQ
jgi:hypothetical protein